MKLGVKSKVVILQRNIIPVKMLSGENFDYHVFMFMLMKNIPHYIVLYNIHIFG